MSLCCLGDAVQFCVKTHYETFILHHRFFRLWVLYVLDQDHEPDCPTVTELLTNWPQSTDAFKKNKAKNKTHHNMHK